MRYFVTGATGFVGGQVARQLRAAGHEVVAVVRNPAKAGDLAALGVEVYQGDVTERIHLQETSHPRQHAGKPLGPHCRGGRVGAARAGTQWQRE